MCKGILATFIALGFAVGCAALSQSPISADEAAGIIDTGAQIKHCEDVGKDAGSYGAYDSCMKDAGLR